MGDSRNGKYCTRFMQYILKLQWIEPIAYIPSYDQLSNVLFGIFLNSILLFYSQYMFSRAESAPLQSSGQTPLTHNLPPNICQ
mmetsp:Transcript_22327/g.29208  ORF Transcript_22327/g.29208 Transcript_22327/m.29208 type:complete len:83 (+) Transcript_22327:112-360(+)